MRPLLRPATVALVTAAAVIAASVALATRSPHRQPPASSILDAPATTSDPSIATAPGPAATLAGARAAALAYLALSEQVVGTDIETAVAAQRAAASTAAAPGLVADLRQRLAALHAAFPAGGIRYRVGPLAVHPVATGTGRTRVEVWYVGVLSAPGTTPFEQWHTSHYDLVWERGAWRVAAESADPGPRPASPLDPPPASTAALEAALAGFAPATGP